ncbi:hypothetical protein K435DRAFT_811423, partial [Dendrothele bispora CBS 962.96]
MALFSRTLRGGKCYAELQAIHLPETRLEPLITRAFEEEFKPANEEDEDFNSELPSPPENHPLPLKRGLDDAAGPNFPSATDSVKKSYRSRKRAKKRAENYERRGHQGGNGAATAVAGLDQVNVEVGDEVLLSATATGGYIAVEQDERGRTIDRPLSWFKEQGFQIIPWDGSQAKVFVDSTNRVICAGVKKIDNPQYTRDLEEAAQLIHEYGNEANFKAHEKSSKRGVGFAACAYGWSYGKGQKRPMRLGGPQAGMMRELLGHQCFHNIAHHQS